jgi:hypothetical protein
MPMPGSGSGVAVKPASGIAVKPAGSSITSVPKAVPMPMPAAGGGGGGTGLAVAAMVVSLISLAVLLMGYLEVL